jgi:hypothetical protein
LFEAARSLGCTFEQAEERNLWAGINASTRAKVELFEAMIEIGFRFGALTPNGPMTWDEFAMLQKAVNFKEFE